MLRYGFVKASFEAEAGDSGAPVLYKQPPYNNRFRLLGIVSARATSYSTYCPYDKIKSGINLSYPLDYDDVYSPIE